MLRVFKYESIAGYGLLLLVCVGLGIHLLLNADLLHVAQENANLVSGNIQSFLAQYLGNYGLWAIFTFLVFLQGMFANRLINIIGLTNQSSLLTAFFFVLLAAWFHPFIFLSPAFIGFLAIIIASHRMYSVLLRDSFTDVFDIGFYTGIAALIHPPYIILIPFFCVFLLLNYLSDWKKWLLFFMGSLLPFYFLGIYWLFTGTTAVDFFSSWIPKLSFLTLEDISNPKSLFKMAVLFVLGIGLAFFTQSSKLELEARRLLRWTVALWGVLAIVGVLFGSSFEEALFMWVFPISLLLGTTLLITEKKVIPEILTLVLIVLVLLFQFF